jgi:microcystin degradation protein MlrC
MKMKNKTTLLGIMMFIPMLLLLALPGFAQKKPVIGVIGMTAESNSFSTQKATLKDYDDDWGQTHEEIVKKFDEMATSKNSISGYIEGAKRFGLELYPAYFPAIHDKGPINGEAFNKIANEIVAKLKAGPKLDGILLHLHGAGVAVGYPSADEEIITRVRKAFGPSMPMVSTHDFHANLTPKWVETTNVDITYKENPHLDTWERGIQAAEIMAKMVKGEVHPVQVLVKPPMIYNIVYQNTFAKPMLPIVDESKKVEKMD